jgi:hypothetical protein
VEAVVDEVDLEVVVADEVDSVVVVGEDSEVVEEVDLEIGNLPLALGNVRSERAAEVDAVASEVEIEKEVVEVDMKGGKEVVSQEEAVVIVETEDLEVDSAVVVVDEEDSVVVEEVGVIEEETEEGSVDEEETVVETDTRLLHYSLSHRDRDRVRHGTRRPSTIQKQYNTIASYTPSIVVHRN